MKLNPIKNTSILVIAVLFIATSCSDPYELVSSDSTEPEIDLIEEWSGDYYVRTYDPNITGRTTTFLGEIVYELEDNPSVEYGFMWYDPEEIDENGNLNIHEIPVGNTNELISFETEVEGLANEKDLVVCSYIRGSNNDTYIGDEINF